MSTTSHSPADFVRENELWPQSVRVRLSRAKRPYENCSFGCYAVEISIFDEPLTFRDLVVDVLKTNGLVVFSAGDRYDPILVGAPKGWRKPRGFVRAGDVHVEGAR